MAIEETSRAYETLIRHNADGSIGAHHVRITEIVKDGTVINASLGVPVSLASASSSDPELAALLGESLVTAVSDAEAAHAALAEAQTALATSNQLVATLTEEKTTLTGQVSALTTQLVSAQTQLTAAQSQIASLTSSTNDLVTKLQETEAELAALKEPAA